MKIFLLTFFILTFSIYGIYAQGNRPSAIIITDRENHAAHNAASGHEQEMRILSPRLYWEGASRSRVPEQIRAGERITLVLRAAFWSSPEPPPAFFMPEVPQNVILAPAQVTSEERYNGIVIKLTLIPLKEGDFILPSRTISYENTRFEIPALTIKIVKKNF